MFRQLWVVIADMLRREGNARILRITGARMAWSRFTRRTVYSVRICRPCRHLSVEGFIQDARFSNKMFPVLSEWKANKYAFRRVEYVGDCRYFRIPVPNWFAVWLRPIVTNKDTRDGWWFGNERTENWERYIGVREDWERLRDAR